MPSRRLALSALLLLAQAGHAAEPGADLLARFDGPPATITQTTIDDEPRYGCDGDLDTAWKPPAQGGQPAALRIDLGGVQPLGGWRLASGAAVIGLEWEGRQAFKPSPGYRVLGCGEDGTWRLLAELRKGASRLAEGERLAHTLAQPAAVHAIEIRLGDLGNLIDLELLGADGAPLPSFARARACAGLRTALRTQGWELRYAAKAAAWLREQGVAELDGGATLEAERTALDQAIAAATRADDAQVAAWGAAVDGLAARVAARVADLDRWCDLRLRADLAATAQARTAAMGGEAGPAAADAAAMAAMAADRDPGRQAAFDHLNAAVDAAWLGWTRRHQAAVRRDGRWWLRADGRRIIPIGFNYAPAGLVPALSNPTLIRRTITSMRDASPRDFRNLRLWGFNAVRLTVRPAMLDLDPRTGEASQAYLAHLGRLLDWARLYDIHVFIELHVDYPPLPLAPANLPYNEMALQPYYRAALPVLAALCRDQPHLIAYEVTANEANIAQGLKAALARRHTDPWYDTATLIDAWHAHLTARHGGLEEAGRFWSATARDPQANAVLGADAAGAVLDPVALARRFPALEPEANTRVRDYLLASQDIHRRQCEELGDAIRRVDPRHLLAFQVNYDLTQIDKAVKSFGTEARLLYGLLPAGVDGIADHYNNAEMAQRFPATGLPWYAGEDWIYNAGTAVFARLLGNGGGALGWAWWPSDVSFEGAVGLDRWLKDSWRAWERAAWFFDHQRSGEPPRAAVALVVPLMAPIPSTLRLPWLLERMDVRFDVLVDEAVARDPAQLDRYQALVVDLDRAALPAVRAVLDRRVPALFTNRQLVDGDNRWGAGTAPALAGAFYRPDHLPAPPAALHEAAGVSLAGTWAFRSDPRGEGDAAGWAAGAGTTGWDRLAAPGYWETEQIGQGRYATYDGIAWYARTLDLPAALRGRDLVFTAILDDTDTAWVNGVRIGATDHATPSWWSAERRYRIAAALLRGDGTDRLVLRIVDEGGNGGIAPGPLHLAPWERDDRTLIWEEDLGGIAAGTRQVVAVGRDLPRVAEADLAPGARVLARFADGSLAVAAAGPHLLWLGGDGVSFGNDREHPDTERALLAAHLRRAGVAMTWPATPASEALEVHRLDGVILVANHGDRPWRLDPDALAAPRRVAWTRLVAAPFRLREAPGPIDIPPNTFAGVVLEPESDR